MPYQLIYTSAPRGLKAGQRGNCTVARSRNLRERLILPLEQLSYYVHLVLPGQTSEVHNPVIHLHRELVVAGTKYRILSRILDAGADHTGRSNHIAHHLIFEENERIGLPSPAIILGHWKGWKDSWEGPPAYIEEKEDPIGKLKGLGEKFGELKDISPEERNIAFARGWETTFTTFLQEKDVKASFRWIGVRDGNKTGLNDDWPSSVDVVKDYRLESINNLDLKDIDRQGAFLENLWQIELLKTSPETQTISAQDGEETKLLEVYATALGLRIHKAQWEAFDRKLKAKREALETEYNEIVTLVSSLDKKIEDIITRCDRTERRGSKCQLAADRQSYDDFIVHHIKPVKNFANDSKSSISEIHNDAKREHEKAMSNIDDGRILADGENTERLNSLRIIDEEVRVRSSNQIAASNAFKKQLDADQEKREKRISFPENEQPTVQVQRDKEATVSPPNETEEINLEVSSEETSDSKSTQQRNNVGPVVYCFLAFLIIVVMALVLLPFILEKDRVIIYKEEKGTSSGVYFVFNKEDNVIYRVTDNDKRFNQLDLLKLVSHYKTTKKKDSLIGIGINGQIRDPYLKTNNPDTLKPEAFKILGSRQKYEEIIKSFARAYKSEKDLDNDELNEIFNSIKKDLTISYYRIKLDKFMKARAVGDVEKLLEKIKVEEPDLSQEVPLLDVLKKVEEFCLNWGDVHKRIEDLNKKDRRPINLLRLFDPNLIRKLRALNMPELNKMAKKQGIPNYDSLQKHELIFQIKLKYQDDTIEYNKELLSSWKIEYEDLKRSIDEFGTDESMTLKLEDALGNWDEAVLNPYFIKWSDIYEKSKDMSKLGQSTLEVQLLSWRLAILYYDTHKKLLQHFPADNSQESAEDWNVLPIDLDEYETVANSNIVKLIAEIKEKDEKEFEEINAICESYKGFNRVQILQIYKINAREIKSINETESQLTCKGKGYKGGDVIFYFKQMNSNWIVHDFELPGSN
jgi:hypothetical protein